MQVMVFMLMTALFVIDREWATAVWVLLAAAFWSLTRILEIRYDKANAKWQAYARAAENLLDVYRESQAQLQQENSELTATHAMLRAALTKP